MEELEHRTDQDIKEQKEQQKERERENTPTATKGDKIEGALGK